MSNVIDSRVVEMQFDNAKFAKNCDNTIKQLDDLDRTLSKTATGADFSVAEKALDNLGKRGADSASQVADSLSSLESRFSAWGTFVGRVVEDVADKFVSLATTVAKSIGEATTIGAMKDGLAEYNLLMESMQSMSVLTHRSTEDINAMFDQLNNYADKTKYSFSDMTRNLSMFAASGASLEEMEVSMEGIANWMAAVGAPASDMSRIIYNIGQAFSKGYLQLIDWKSIENSKGMNGQQFVERFVKNAYELGKMDGETYADAMTAAAEGNLSGWFRESISGKNAFKGFDKDVMLATFKDFAENPEYMKAATQLKTFKELLDNVKEEMGSGWQVTWRNVIGDLDNATRLMKGLKDSLTEYWDLGGENRNALIQDFNKLGGAENTYRILTDMVKVIGEIKNAFMSGWNTNFAEITGFTMWQKSAEIAYDVRNLLESMKTGNWLTDSFEKLGDTTGNAVANVKLLFDAIGGLISNHSEGLGQLAGKIFDIGVSLNDRLFNSIGKIAEKLTDLDHGALGKIIDDIGAITYALADLADWAVDQGFLGKAFNAVWKSLEDGVDSIEIIKESFSGLSDFIDSTRDKIAGWAIDLAGNTKDGTFLHWFAEAIIDLHVKINDLKEVLGDLKVSWDDCWEAVHEGDWTRFSTFISESLIPAFEKVFSFNMNDFIDKMQEIAFWRPDFSQFLNDMQTIWGSLEFGEDILTNIKLAFVALGDTIVAFWHRISSTGIFGSAFTSLKEKIGLDDTDTFDLSAFEDIFNLFKKGGDTVEESSEKIIKSVNEMSKFFGGPNTQKISVESLSLDGPEYKDMEESASIWETIKNKFATYWDYVKSIDINEDGIANWLKLFTVVGLGKTLRIVANAIKQFADNGGTILKGLDPWAKLPEKLNGLLGAITMSVTKYGEKLGSEAFANKWSTIGKVFLEIVGAIAIFGILEKLDVDVMGNALVVAGLFAVLVTVMDKASLFASKMDALNSAGIALACVGFASVIGKLTTCIVALTLCAAAWGKMNTSQVVEIFVSFGVIVAAAFGALIVAGSLMAKMWTDLDWAVMILVLGSIGKLFKTMALVLGELTLIEALGGDHVRDGIMDLVAIWGMVELLVVTVMGFATKNVITEKSVLETIAILYMVKRLFTSLTTALIALTITNELSTEAWTALGQLALVFTMVEALMWSAAGCAAVCQQTGIAVGLASVTAAIDQMGDMLTAMGLVVVAFSILGPDKVKTALIELAAVLAELIVTVAAFSAINKFLNGGMSLNITGLVALIGSMALVVAALAAFQAATTSASPEQVQAAIDAFNAMMISLGAVFAGMALLAAAAAAAQEYGAIAIGALTVLAAVWVAISAGALLAGVAALEMGKAFQLVVEAFDKFTELDVQTVVEKGQILLDWLSISLPEALVKGAANLIAGLAVIKPLISVELVGLLADVITVLAAEMPKFIEATDKLIAASLAQFTLDLTKYGSLIIAALTVDIDELATLVQSSQGIITALGRLGDSLMNTLIASLVGKEFADKLVPVADSFTGQLKSALQQKIPELNEQGYFMMDSISTGLEKKAEESKFSLFTKGKESADSFGQGMISQQDIMSAFGMTLGTQAATSLADEEVQSVYRNAGMADGSAFGTGFSSPELEGILKTFGIDSAGLLSSEEVLGSFGNSANADLSAWYEQMIAENPELEEALKASGIEYGNLFQDETVQDSFRTSGDEDISAFNDAQKKQLTSQRPDMIAYAAKEVETYYKAQEVLDSSKKSGEAITKSAASGMQSQEAMAGARKAGENLSAGAAQGLESHAYSSNGILTKAGGIAGMVIDRLRRAWDEHSPSRVADELGAYFGMGLTNGLVREGAYAVEQSQTIAEDISEAFTNMNAEGFDDGVFTITPEVDLKYVEDAAKRTSDLFNRNNSMAMSAKYGLAGTDGSYGGDTYNINVNDSDTSNGFAVGRDIEKYLVRRY